MGRVLALCVLSACAPFSPGSGPSEADLEAARALLEGSPEALGVLALLNDPGTDGALLDDDVGLDARAARNLIARRNGPDGQVGTPDDAPFRTIAEVDAVSYVGPSALARLLAYADAAGWIPSDADPFGVYDNVPFTVGEAAATLALANGADLVWLDDTLGLDSRAVGSIAGARPIADLPTLAGLPWVGESALRALKRAATVEPSEVPIEQRFVADLEPTLVTWYGQHGADAAAMGGNTLAQAIAALDPALVVELTDPEDDPYGHDFDRFRVLTHPDVVFPGSDMVWFGIYDRVTGDLSGTNWFN